VPVNLGCRVLFTTRRRDVDGRFGSIEVSVLPEEAALELLLSAPGRRELWERRGEAEAGREIAAGRGICRAFGGLPLALTLAAAFLGKRPRISLGDYLERVVERGAISSTDENRIPATDLATRHGAAVAATFRSQWDTVETEEARLVLRVAALLGEAAEISPARLSLLTGLEAKGKKGFAAPLEEALGELVGLSLVENLGAKGAIRLHPLVREFVKRGTPWPGAFGYVCAKRLGDALWDMGRLHEEITGRGVDVVLGDLRIGERLAGPAGAAHTVSLRTVLEREAHSLRRWETDEEPAFLLQQIGNRGFEMDLDGVRERAHRALAAKRWPYLCERVRTSRESEALVRTVEGHTHVNDVAVTPDGRLAVFASSGMVLQVFDLVTGQAIRTLEGHMHSVLGVAMTPDGRLVVSASADGTLKVWDLATGRAVCTLEGHTDMVRSVAVTQDGRFAVSASDDKRLKVWDLASGQTVCTLEGHASSVLGVALTPDGRFAVSASWDHTLKMWDLASGQAIRTFEEHADPVAGVVVTPDGRFAVSASYGRMLKVWDLATGRAVSTLEGHSDVVAGVAVTPDGRFAVSASWDKTLKVWNLASGQAVRTLEGHAHHVTGVAVTPDGRFAVSASDDKTLKVWDLVFRQVVRTLEEDVAAACSVATTPDGRFAVSASYDRMLKVWDLASGQVIRTLKGNSCVAVTPDGRFVLSFDDRSLIAWNLDSGRAFRGGYEHDDRVNSLVVTPDGRFAVSASDDKTLRVWDLAFRSAVRTFKGHASSVNGVTVTPDGRFAVSASRDKTLKVWDLASGQVIGTLKGHTLAVNGAAVTPDGRFAVSASDDETLKVWDMGSGQAILTFKGHTDSVTGVAVAPNGRLAVSASADRTLRLWHLPTGRMYATLETQAPLRCCAISPDGRTILAGDALGGLHILDWVTWDDPPP
jgi:WD40 repeat protein